MYMCVYLKIHKIETLLKSKHIKVNYFNYNLTLYVLQPIYIYIRYARIPSTLNHMRCIKNVFFNIIILRIYIV